MSIIKQDYGSLGNDVQTQMLIAPVLAEMIATQAFVINDQFIVDNVLYKATKAIAIGDAISVGTSTTDNCVLSDTITQQINNISNRLYVQRIESGITSNDLTEIKNWFNANNQRIPIAQFVIVEFGLVTCMVHKVSSSYGRAKILSYYPANDKSSRLVDGIWSDFT